MRLVFLILGLLFSLSFAELIFYWFNYPNNSSQPQYLPGSSESDPTIGWKHKPGAYFYNSLGGDPYKFGFTILKDGSRATGETNDYSKPIIALFGCSFTAGFGLDDRQTFAWKLQDSFPKYAVVNFAVGGYGTIHSLIRLKQFIEQRKEGDPPAIVIYGFADFHILRNIKNPQMHRYWHSKGFFPYCDMQSCGVWEGKSMGGLLGYSRVFSMLENLWDAWTVLPETQEATQITEKLILEMQKISISHGIKFFVAPVSINDSSWIDKFNTDHVPVIDCDSRLLHSQAYRLSDGHPNERWNDAFATCLKSKLAVITN